MQVYLRRQILVKHWINLKGREDNRPTVKVLWVFGCKILAHVIGLVVPVWLIKASIRHGVEANVDKM